MMGVFVLPTEPTPTLVEILTNYFSGLEADDWTALVSAIISVVMAGISYRAYRYTKRITVATEQANAIAILPHKTALYDAVSTFEQFLASDGGEIGPAVIDTFVKATDVSQVYLPAELEQRLSSLRDTALKFHRARRSKRTAELQPTLPDKYDELVDTAYEHLNRLNEETPQLVKDLKADLKLTK
ncbi:MAG: hypothetical protein KDJ38_09110 [Gammaproteobacteria bacterium]|nr:hypothetical protein [Gammaproteobacteria bacterium]